MVFWLAEIAFVLLSAGLAVWSPALKIEIFLLSAPLLILSCLKRFKQPVKDGCLRVDRILLLVCLFLLTTSLHLRIATGLAGWWPLTVAGLLVFIGLSNALNDRRQGHFWSKTRVEMTWAGAILVVASAFTAITFRLMLVYCTSLAIPPGRLDFMAVMTVWTSVWFGLDTHLRRVNDLEKPGHAFWLWNQRHAFVLLTAALVILIKTEFI